MATYRPARNLLEAFERTVAEQPADVAVHCALDPRFADLTWQDYRRYAASLGSALSRWGLRPGERVALLLPHAAAFHLADAGVLAAGGVPFSIYDTSSEHQIAELVRRSGCRLAVAWAGERADRMARAAGAGGLDLTVLTAGPAAKGACLESLLDGPDTGMLTGSAADLDRRDVATVIYTSGSTGVPKAVPISHGNALAAYEATAHIVGDDGRGVRLVSYLPMAHVAERMSTHYNHLIYGSEVFCCPDQGELVATMRRVRPHIFFGPPRVWEKLLTATGGSGDVPVPDRRRAVVEAGLGDLRVAVSGAAPLSPQLLVDLRAAGVPLAEVYGLSETTGVLTWDHQEVRIGTVGRPLPGVRVRLFDGEIQCRGAVVFAGYLDRAPGQDDSFTEDGWFRTGDLGAFDERGYLRIVGRRKDLLVTSNGKNVAPAPLEHQLRQIPGVEHGVVIGDGRPFITALVVLAPEHSVSEDELVAQLTWINARTSRAEGIRRVAVLRDDWSAEPDLLTATHKLRRSVVLDRYRGVIDDLYAGGGLSVPDRPATPTPVP